MTPDRDAHRRLHAIELALLVAERDTLRRVLEISPVLDAPVPEPSRPEPTLVLVPPTEQWLTTAEAADSAGVPIDTVYGWIRDGLPAEKRGRQHQISSVELDTWIHTPDRPRGRHQRIGAAA